jgi:cytidylate kinase
MIITVSREFGSGGHIVGRNIADALNVPFFDKELINLSAKESGLAEEIMEEMEQKRTASYLYNIYITSQSSPLSERIYLAQSNVIRRLADENKGCVIIGRCADYVLRKRGDVVNLFIHAPMSFKVKRIAEDYGVEEKNAENLIKKKDKERAAHYNFYTQQKFGDLKNYHLSINSAIGLEAAAEVALCYIRLNGGINEPV